MKKLMLLLTCICASGSLAAKNRHDDFSSCESDDRSEVYDRNDESDGADVRHLIGKNYEGTIYDDEDEDGLDWFERH